MRAASSPDAPSTKSDSTPRGHFITEQGRRYWSNRGTSNGKVSGIPFGTPGSFDECISRVEPHLGAGAPGYCAERYHEAVGRWPGRHGGSR